MSATDDLGAYALKPGDQYYGTRAAYTIGKKRKTDAEAAAAAAIKDAAYQAKLISTSPDEAALKIAARRKAASMRRGRASTILGGADRSRVTGQSTTLLGGMRDPLG